LEFQLLNNAILLRGRRVPFVLLLKRSAAFMETVQVDALEFKLKRVTTYPNDSSIGRRSIRETTIFSKSNLNYVLPLGIDELSIRSEDLTPPVHVPTWVSPTCKVCNIVKTYSLILRVTLRDERSKREHLLLGRDVVVDPGEVPSELPTYEQCLQDDSV
jgi:hypothetical protein